MLRFFRPIVRLIDRSFDRSFERLSPNAIEHPWPIEAPNPVGDRGVTNGIGLYAGHVVSKILIHKEKHMRTHVRFNDLKYHGPSLLTETFENNYTFVDA